MKPKQINYNRRVVGTAPIKVATTDFVPPKTIGNANLEALAVPTSVAVNDVPAEAVKPLVALPVPTAKMKTSSMQSENNAENNAHLLGNENDTPMAVDNSENTEPTATTTTTTFTKKNYYTNLVLQVIILALAVRIIRRKLQ